MDVVVYQIRSNYHLLARMGRALAEALQSKGVSATFYLQGSKTTEAEVLDDLKSAGTRAVISFNSGTAEWTYDRQRSVYDALDCGFIGWDADHPAYNPTRFTLPMAKRAQICASASHIAFARAMGCQGASRLMLPGAELAAEPVIPLAERPIYGLVAMSWLGEPEIWWADRKGTPDHALIEGMIARLLADPDADIFAAFTNTTSDLGMAPVLESRTYQLIAEVGRFVRQYDRLRLAQAIVASKAPCAICGEGWRERLGDPAHLLYTDSLDFEGLAKLYGHARVVFNVNGSNGASERAVNAMASGAMVASDHSPMLEASFGPGHAMAFYDRRDMSGVHEALAMNSEQQQAVAERGRQQIAAAHLWSHKAESLIQLLREPPFGIDVVTHTVAS